MGVAEERKALERMSGAMRRLVQPQPSPTSLPAEAPATETAAAGKASEPSQAGTRPR